jgi:hypothetical protein
MKQGIGLLNDGRPESIIEAVTCFDGALELRRRLPLDAVPVSLCGTIARRLPQSNDAPFLLKDVHDATDLADEGLDLVRRWEQKGVTRFRDLALDLFRFGAAAYQRYQPRFFTEFVLENTELITSRARRNQ